MSGETFMLERREVEVVSETPIESEQYWTDDQGKRHSRPLPYTALLVREVKRDQGGDQ